MKLYTYLSKKQQCIGAGLDGRLVDLNAAYAARLEAVAVFDDGIGQFAGAADFEFADVTVTPPNS